MAWLFAAFLVTWIIFFAYAISLDRKQKALADEVESLVSRLSK